MNLIGKIIGNRYEILEEVGNGGMATVYKAKDHVLNRYVAVKVLKDEYTTDSDFIKRFNTEAQSAASLSHANIVSIYDVGHEEENNLYYIVMELVKGKTLKEIIKKDGTLSWKWAVNIAIQIASALEVAHKNGIIHRDIKPHNIIITEDGVAKVTDFGIAKAVSNSTMTAFGTTIGSVHYFSPEQAKGGITDAKSDLYSLGVVMYEMLTGKVPFDADTPVSIALKHMQEEAEEPIEINPEIPTAVNQIVIKAMKKDPIERYQSATEMIRDLTQSLKDPDGDFVIIENKDGEYTRVMKAMPSDETDSRKNNSKNSNFFTEHPKAKIAIFALSLVLLFVIVFFVTKIALDGGITKKVNIPNLVDKTAEAAENEINSLNLKMEKEEIASSTVEAGKVISQEPPYKEGEKVEEGSIIKVVVSKGPETTALPGFVGSTIEDVRETAKEIGIILKEENQSSDTVEAGYVIKQDTKEGVMVKSGDTVTVYVSTGVKKTKVPTVIDMDEGTAKATLSNANLKVNVTYKSDETKTDGKVISQSIDQGKEVAEGTTIEIVVNKIEKKQKTVNVRFIIPKISTSTTSKDNTTTETSNNATITVKINGSTRVNGKTVEIGKEVDCGTVTGSGTQKIEVEITENGVKKAITNEFNIDDYEDNGTYYIKDK